MSAQASLFPSRVVVVPSRDELPLPWRLWPEPIAVCCGCAVVHPDWSALTRPAIRQWLLENKIKIKPNTAHHAEDCGGADYRIWGGQ